jgi:phosphate-selective porin OprO/OprP
VSTADGRDAALAALSVLRPTVLAEVDGRAYPALEEGRSGFALGRLRGGLILEPASAAWFRGVSTIEFAGETPVLLDAYAQLRATPWIRFDVGLWKGPLFTSFLHEPVHLMPFPDRAPVQVAFRVRRDLGATIDLTPKRAPIEIVGRISNGSGGSALANDNALPAGTLIVDLVFGRARRATATGDETWGLRLGGGAMVEDVEDRDGSAGRTPMGFVYARPIVVSGLRVVAEGHIVAYVRKLRFTFEGAMAREGRRFDGDGNPATPRQTLPMATSWGATTELAWVVLGGARSIGKAPSPRRGHEGRWGGGALEFAARWDGLWFNEGLQDVVAGGSQGGALAIKWFPVELLTVSLTGYGTVYDTPAPERPMTRVSWGVLGRLGFFWGQRAPAARRPGR